MNAVDAPVIAAIVAIIFLHQLIVLIVQHNDDPVSVSAL
jgi:hypothetical protein